MARARAAKPAADETAALDPSPLLTTYDAARFLGVSPRTLANWRTRELGPPFVRISGRSVKYRPQDLQRWARGFVNTPTGVKDTRRVQKAKAAAAAEGTQK
jgi:Helix-turn-helix domain